MPRTAAFPQRSRSSKNDPSRARKEAVPCDPRTQSEWQEAVNIAEWLIQLDAGQRYGLVLIRPGATNLERCDDILAAGRKRGVFPLLGVPCSQLKAQSS